MAASGSSYQHHQCSTHGFLWTMKTVGQSLNKSMTTVTVPVYVNSQHNN